MPKIVNHHQRRQEISACAAGLIARGGLEAATIREIASASGYSKGVVEHYFDNKAEIISAALEWANAGYEQRVREATVGLSGLAALHQRILATLPLDDARRDEWKIRLIFWSMATLNPSLEAQQQQRHQQAVRFFEEDLAAAERAGEIAPIATRRARARRLLHLISGLSSAALHSPTLYTPQLLQQEATYLSHTLTASL